MKLGFVSNVPAPYKTPRLNALANRDEIDLTVIYANDRTHRHKYTDLVDREFPATILDSSRILIPGTGSEFMIDAKSFLTLYRMDADAFVVGGWNYLAAWNALLVSKLRGLPIGVISENISQNTRLSRAVMSRVLMLFDAYFSTGIRAADHLESLGILENNIQVLPYCIDIDAFQDSIDKQEVELLRQRYGLEDEFIVLYVGLLEDRKGVDDLIDAVEGLDESHLLLIGDGPKRDTLEAKASSQLGDRVTFTGELPNQKLPNYYAMADTFVLPSHYDPWGLVLNEAIACGTPVVTTTGAGAAGDLIENDKTGLVVPPGDPDALRDALHSLRDSSERRVKLRECALERSDAYTPERYAELIASTMVSLVAGRQ